MAKCVLCKDNQAKTTKCIAKNNKAICQKCCEKIQNENFCAECASFNKTKNNNISTKEKPVLYDNFEGEASLRISNYTISYKWIAIFLLIFCTLFVYYQTTNFPFINYDDDTYVFDNQNVKRGLVKENIPYIFKGICAANWHPTTMLSHILDVTFFGLNANLHHTTNLIFHLLNTLLFFFLFFKASRHLWPSFFLAAIFAAHPSHVESVAWIAERKDVLSTFFWASSSLFYLYFVNTKLKKYYIASAMMLAIGLTAKPMLVTLPCTLILLDIWPLNRENFVEAGTKDKIQIFKKLLIEKIPLFLLSFAMSGLTFYIQKLSGAMGSFKALSLDARISNTLISYIKYIYKFFVPINLGVFYPHTLKSYPLYAFLSFAAIVIITIVCLKLFKKHSYLLIGWLWFLGTLVPVIGLIQVGAQEMADRYTYLTYIGLSIMLAWGIFYFTSNIRNRKYIRIAAIFAFTAMLTVMGYKQCSYWKSSVDLFEHTLKVTKENYIIHNNLGVTFLRQGQLKLAEDHCRRALEIKSNYATAASNLGLILRKQERYKDAIMVYQVELQKRPTNLDSLKNLAICLTKVNQFSAATQFYEKSLEQTPNSLDILFNFALNYLKLKDVNKALEIYEKIINMTNHDLIALNKIGNVLMEENFLGEADLMCLRTLKYYPDTAVSHYNLGCVRLKMGKTKEAIEAFDKAQSLNQAKDEQITYGYAYALYTTKEYDKAIVLFKEILDVYPNHHKALEGITISLLNSNKIPEAYEFFRNFLHRNPKHAIAHNTMGVILTRLNKPDDAFKAFSYAYSLAPDNATIKANYEKAKQLQDAEKK